MRQPAPQAYYDIDHEALRKDLDYDTDTGIFRWKRCVARRIKPGDVAGYRDSDGYVNLKWHGRQYRLHRLAWFYTYGRWPEGEIDHVNMLRDDNRLCNLREATQSQNAGNRRAYANNTSGYKGVSYSKA